MSGCANLAAYIYWPRGAEAGLARKLSNRGDGGGTLESNRALLCRKALSKPAAEASEVASGKKRNVAWQGAEFWSRPGSQGWTSGVGAY